MYTGLKWHAASIYIQRKYNLINTSCILDIRGEYIIQKWPLFIQTPEAVHSLWYLPHFQIPLLHCSQRLPVLVSSRAITKHALELLEFYLENLHTCKHSQVPGPAEEFPNG